jgi:hypothetical protein
LRWRALTAGGLCFAMLCGCRGRSSFAEVCYAVSLCLRLQLEWGGVGRLHTALALSNAV